MPYEREICRTHPLLVVFLLNQSRAMAEPLGGSYPEGHTKADEATAQVNEAIAALLSHCPAGHDGPLPWIEIAAIGYRTDELAKPYVQSAFASPVLARKRVCSTGEIDRECAIRSGAKLFFDEDSGETVELTVDIPIWVEPRAEGQGPMRAGLSDVCELVKGWIKTGHEESFPPLVIHLTGDASSDDQPDPRDEARRIMDLATRDGQVLLFHVHLAKQNEDPCLWPDGEEFLPDPASRRLFQMSSILPKVLVQRAQNEGFGIRPQARGLGVNIGMASLFTILNWGD